ncbi:hypothetical protein OPV22_017318 [Ensete ventricosum]|uniref:DUF632 domain-containing protein n=1 Tax=Ensete ventricosum TaxID=4639 RepID=A0AAV8R1X3_ENSVE|nr:hypothetical protein OPV22_017318 [Ensete ventricosum]
MQLLNLCSSCTLTKVRRSQPHVAIYLPSLLPWIRFLSLVLPRVNARTRVPLDQQRHVLLDSLWEVEERFWRSHEEKGGFANISRSIGSHLSTSSQGWSHFRLETKEIGVEIEEIRDEAAALEILIDA